MRGAATVIDRDKGWGALMLAVQKVRRGVHARIGFFDNSEDHDGLSMAELGGIHEFGSSDGRIPERSFLRSTMNRMRAGYADAFTKIVGAFLDGKISMDKGMEALGMQGVADVRATIRAGIDPPNAKSTVIRKGSATPLIDTGRLLMAIAHQVVWGER